MKREQKKRDFEIAHKIFIQLEGQNNSKIVKKRLSHDLKLDLELFNKDRDEQHPDLAKLLKLFN